jgi:hypothetical protein
MAQKSRASALVALCLAVTGTTIAWADESHRVRDRWVEDPYEPHDTTGNEVRFGTLVAVLVVDGREFTGLGGMVSAGHRWGRVTVDAEYGYLEVTERGPSTLRFGAAHQLGVNLRLDVLRFGPRVVGPNSMAAIYVEGHAGRQHRVADPLPEIEGSSRSRMHGGASNQLASGFGVMFDHRLEQPRGFPNRVGWQLGWRIVGTPRPLPDSLITCRGDECSAARMTSEPMRFGVTETSLIVSSSLAFTW